MYFVRHGESVPNALGVRCGGDRDPELTESGLVDAAALGRGLPRLAIPPGVVVTAPLRRTMLTAEPIVAELGVNLVVLEDLRERILGDWNGLPVAETKAALDAGETPPGGESRAEFACRVRRGLETALNLPGQPCLVVGSRGTARVILEALLGVEGFDLTNAAVVEILFGDKEQGSYRLVPLSTAPDRIAS